MWYGTLMSCWLHWPQQSLHGCALPPGSKKSLGDLLVSAQTCWVQCRWEKSGAGCSSWATWSRQCRTGYWGQMQAQPACCLVRAAAPASKGAWILGGKQGVPPLQGLHCPATKPAPRHRHRVRETRLQKYPLLFISWWQCMAGLTWLSPLCLEPGNAGSCLACWAAQAAKKTFAECAVLRCLKAPTCRRTPKFALIHLRLRRIKVSLT